MIKTVGIILIAFVVFFIIILLLFPPIQVVGYSMYPTYNDGEIIFATRLYRKSKIKKGDVFVFKPPYDMGEIKILIKRVEDIEKDTNDKIVAIYFVGDNRDHSNDSRHFGYVHVKHLIGKVVNERALEE